MLWDQRVGTITAVEIDDGSDQLVLCMNVNRKEERRKVGGTYLFIWSVVPEGLRYFSDALRPVVAYAAKTPTTSFCGRRLCCVSSNLLNCNIRIIFLLADFLGRPTRTEGEVNRRQKEEKKNWQIRGS